MFVGRGNGRLLVGVIAGVVGVETGYDAVQLFWRGQQLTGRFLVG